MSYIKQNFQMLVILSCVQTNNGPNRYNKPWFAIELIFDLIPSFHHEVVDFDQ